MNLRLLKVFVTVVDAGSFSKAAQELNVSQPAVSKAVRELESQLDTVLLDRRGHSFVPSEAGSALLSYGRSIAALEREAQEAMNAFHGLSRGRLNIGASTTIATYWLAPHLVEFQKRYPDLELRVISANTQRVVELLLDCELDIALVEGAVSDERVEARPWTDEEMVVIAPKQPAAITEEALKEQRWVVREPGSGSRAATDALFDRLGGIRPRLTQVGSNQAVIQMVAVGGGVGLVPRVGAQAQLELGRIQLVPLGDGPIRRQLYRLRLPHRPISNAALAFEAIVARINHTT
ncbi:MAG: LysR family transcriptional regulator [Ectothiorhodospiraceae bacterium]|nr:LysR family transcriptional regulator [Ectothiorhodospiraceae bacterium]